MSGDTITVLVHNARSLPRHVDNTVNANRIIGFTETQIKSSDSTCKIIETLNLFNIIFNNNKNVECQFIENKSCIFQMLEYLLLTNSIDIIAGDFKYDILKVSQNDF